MKLTTLCLTALCLVSALSAAPPPVSAASGTMTKMGAMAKPHVPAATVYQCSKCHMKYSAADAKKNHYKDPMDGGTLVPVKAAKPAAMSTMKK